MTELPGRAVLSSKEIASQAADFEFPDGKSLDTWLNTANLLNNQALASIARGSNRTAYEYGMRYAEIVLNKIVKHPDYNEASTELKLKKMLKAVEQLLDLLEPIRVAIDDEYNTFTENERLFSAHKAELNRQAAFRHRSTSEPSNEAWDIVKEMQGLIIQDAKTRREASVQEQKFLYPKVHQPSAQWDTTIQRQSFVDNQYFPERPAKIMTKPTSPSGQLLDSLMKEEKEASLESGEPLRSVFIPGELRACFLELASQNTARNLETCGILCGLLKNNAFHVNMLVIPAQESTSNTCATTDEELLFEFQEKRDLLTLGWIHTHPSQTCFLSSVDLHTHCSYQLMLREAVAIVCAPKHKPDWGAFRLTDPPGAHIIKNCRVRSLFHQHDGGPIYCDAMYPGHVREVIGMKFDSVDLRQYKDSTIR